MKYVIYLLLAGFLGYLIYGAGLMGWRIKESVSFAQGVKPFSRVVEDASAEMLILGDSTAVGVGASSPERTIAGRFAAEFPTVSITNIGQNGMRLRDFSNLVASLEQLTPEQHYDLLLIQVGANDILRYTNLQALRQDLRTILQFAEEKSDRTIILHSGNIGTGPFFVWPIGPVLTDRTRVVRQIYLEETRTYAGVNYVDLFVEEADDVFVLAPEQFYSEDLLHLSDEGYRVWYEKIRETMDSAGVSL